MPGPSRVSPLAVANFSTDASRQTTRTATSARGPAPRTSHLLQPGQVIRSPETFVQYSIGRLLGEGGFGQVYLARRLGRSRDVPEILCVKVSIRIDGWLREAYFGQLLDGHPRGIAGSGSSTRFRWSDPRPEFSTASRSSPRASAI